MASMLNPTNYYPQQAPQMYPPQMPAMQPSASAVSINIIGPQAYAGPPAQAQYPAPQTYNYPSVPMYNYPTNPIYDMPQVPAYNPQQPPMGPMLQVPQMPPQAQTQVPPQFQNPMQPPVPQEQVPQNQVPPQQPENQQPTAEQKQNEFNNALDELNTVLTSPNLDEQGVAVEKVTQLASSDLRNAFLDPSAAAKTEDIIFNLAKIAANDTSKLKGAEKEKAERNKAVSMLTTSLLGSNYRDQVNVALQQQGKPPLTINDVPGIVPIVKNINSSDNPGVKAAAITALSQLARPEDAPIVGKILEKALKDKNNDVKTTATQLMQQLQQGS